VSCCTILCLVAKSRLLVLLMLIDRVHVIFMFKPKLSVYTIKMLNRCSIESVASKAAVFVIVANEDHVWTNKSSILSDAY